MTPIVWSLEALMDLPKVDRPGRPELSLEPKCLNLNLVLFTLHFPG